MNKFLDVQLPFFIPLWRRVAVVAICLVWTVIEFYNASPFWGLLFGGLGVYSAWQFFVVFDPKDPADPGKKD